MTVRDDIFQQLEEYRQCGEFCDLTVSIARDNFSVHKNIVAAASPFIKEVLKQDEFTVKLDSCTALGFNCFLDYVYREELTFDPFTVFEALQAADELQCQPYRDACLEYVKKNINEDTCLSYITLTCKDVTLTEIYNASVQFFCQNTLKISQMDAEINNLPTGILCQILQHTNTQQSHKEIELLQFCIQWSQKNPETEPMEVVQHINIENLRAEDIDNILESEFIQQHQLLDRHLLKMFRKKMTETTNETTNGAEAIQDEIASGASAKLEPVQSDVILGVSYHFQRLFFLYNYTKQEPMQDQVVMKVDNSAQCVFVGNSIFLIGGHNSDRLTSYNHTDKTWRMLSCLRRKGLHRAIFVMGDFIYTVGGELDAKSFHNEVDRYSISTDRWTQCPMGPNVVFGQSPCVVDGKVFISGGTDKVTQLDTIYECDLGAGKWKLICHMMAERSFHFTCAFDSQMYIIGGKNCPSPSMEVFDPTTNQFTALADFNIANIIGNHPACNYLKAIQVSPGFVFVMNQYMYLANNFIVIDLQQNTVIKKTIEGLDAKYCIALCRATLQT